MADKITNTGLIILFVAIPFGFLIGEYTLLLSGFGLGLIVGAMTK